MKRFLFVLSFMMLAASTGLAQDKTVETRVEIDSATGQRRVISAETISTTEDITPRSHMIVINPLKFIFYYNLSYYQRLDKNLVIGGGLQMPTISGLGGFGANAEIRLHPSGKAMRGFYVAPNVSFNTYTAETYVDYDSETGTYTTGDHTATAFSVGGLIGWQWFPGDEFAFGLGIGADYYFLSSDYKSSSGADPFKSFNGIAPALRIDIGYAW